MKTIKQQQEINFNAITFKDAIIMLPLMNELTNAINQNRVANFYNNLPEDEKTKYHQVWRKTDIRLSAQETEAIFNLLNELGFESSDELKEPSIQNLELKK